MAVIDMKNVSYAYRKGEKALNNVDLKVRKGEWLAILGHNGSGKSTLAKLLVGLLVPDEGSITIDGVPLDFDHIREARRKIGIVFQNPDNQFVGVTVRDDIAFGLENLMIPREEMIERIEHYARKVDMADFLNKEPHTLSGGQKQRIAIAGILAMHTDIIIFDEATSMLDPKGRRMVFDTIEALHKEGVTLLTITHDMKEAVKSDRVVVMKHGEILKIATPAELFKDKETLASAYLEPLVPMRIADALAEKDIMNGELEELLWALSMNA